MAAARVFTRSKEARRIRWHLGRSRDTEFEETALVHLDALYNLGLRLTHDRTEAEDLVQETYLRAFKNFHRFNPGTNCRAWLFTILRNVFLNRIRRNRTEVLEGDAGLPDAGLDGLPSIAFGGTPEEHFLQTILHGDVERALRVLPPSFREAIVLADLEGLSYREVAEVLGCPIGTVMSRLSRGRAMLRHGLTRLGRERGYVKEEE
jgi:RNA polymerase sigma-70 factor (ECF subfamily)